MRVLAIDPGSEKCGLAVVEDTQKILAHEVVSTAKIGAALSDWIRKWAPRHVLLGDATFSKNIKTVIGPLLDGTPLSVVDERDSTYRGRKLYFAVNPPKGIWRFIPLGLQVPPEPYDDFAAALLALRWFEGNKTA